ncbi:MAG: stage 0 sporulation family protein [Lachnospiraceae bacterium]|nr:stage 0 sporulation family protein [Lachnospiraceae bacterium]
MKKIVSVRFRSGGKPYYFDPLNFELKRGSHVIVETVRGIEYGTVVGEIREVEDEKIQQPLKPIMRVATPKDDEQDTQNREKEKSAISVAKEKIRKHELDMKLIDVEYTFDRNKIVFYFTADGRVDFRELVKDLAGVFHTRIELRQIGVRDATKMLGGLGSCGRELCCHAYMADFVPVSIKMAKEQNLSLNPGKISGMCGRLMCCLQYESDTYSWLNRKLPRVGDDVTTPYGNVAKVQSVDVLRQRVRVIVDVNDEKEIEEYAVEELKFTKRQGGGGNKKDKNDRKNDRNDRGNQEKLSKEELRELAELEKKDN